MEILSTRKQKTDFFARFEEAAQNNAEGARQLQEFCNDFTDAEERVRRLHDLEHKGDEITHAVYEALNRTFIPPLDREDIIAITTALDDVMDHIHESADAMCITNVQRPTPIACKLAGCIAQCTQHLTTLIPLLRSRSKMRQVEAGVIEIHRLENEADALLREGMKDLFHRPQDPVQVIAWSRIYEMLERVTDDCEDVADVVRGLAIKHA